LGNRIHNIGNKYGCQNKHQFNHNQLLFYDFYGGKENPDLALLKET